MTETVLSKNFMSTDFGSGTNLVESIKKYIHEHDCPNLSMDISDLNIIDASKVTVLCSTYHWAKYPEGKISWKISSAEVKDIINPLNLGNMSLITAP